MGGVPKCPRCGRAIPNEDRPGEYPGALSRYDNATEICSPCGLDEAMWDLQRPHEQMPPPNVPVWGGP